MSEQESSVPRYLNYSLEQTPDWSMAVHAETLRTTAASSSPGHWPYAKLWTLPTSSNQFSEGSWRSPTGKKYRPLQLFFKQLATDQVQAFHHAHVRTQLSSPAGSGACEPLSSGLGGRCCSAAPRPRGRGTRAWGGAGPRPRGWGTTRPRSARPLRPWGCPAGPARPCRLPARPSPTPALPQGRAGQTPGPAPGPALTLSLRRAGPGKDSAAGPCAIGAGCRERRGGARGSGCCPAAGKGRAPAGKGREGQGWAGSGVRGRRWPWSPVRGWGGAPLRAGTARTRSSKARASQSFETPVINPAPCQSVMETQLRIRCWPPLQAEAWCTSPHSTGHIGLSDTRVTTTAVPGMEWPLIFQYLNSLNLQAPALNRNLVVLFHRQKNSKIINLNKRTPKHLLDQ